MRLTVLSENASLRDDLIPEFGLSVYLEKGDVRLLFDMGTRDAFLKNAGVLGIDLSGCTAIAFSHNHYDHTGGFVSFTERVAPVCPVYVHRGFFTNKYWDHRFDPEEQPTHADTIELVGPVFDRGFAFRRGVTTFRELASDVFPLGDGVYLLGNFPVPDGFEAVNPSSVMESPEGELVRDTFRDEQICVAETSRGLVVLTGCAHNGIVNIIETVKQRFPGKNVYAVVGGTHLVIPDENRLARTLRYFNEEQIGIAGVCHCTGIAGTEAFRAAVPGYRPTAAGFVLETED